MNKIVMMTLLVSCASLFAAEEKRDGAKKTDAVRDTAQTEKRAMRMVTSAVALLAGKEDDSRAVGMLEAVERMYSDTQARFSAALELGRHFIGKRDLDRALAELKKCDAASDPEVRAEALLLQGDLYRAKQRPGEAAMVLRRLTQDYPTSDFANEAFFRIGQIHFEASRWTRASEAFEMVGTAVPVAKTNEIAICEAGQCIYAHVTDKDLAVLAAMGVTNRIELTGSDNDRETAVLQPFGKGDGDFIASVKTSVEPSLPNDGVLTARGNDPIRVVYLDANTQQGELNKPRKAEAFTVSSGAVAFLDGAMRQTVRGVFVDQPAFIRIRDFDLDITDKPDAAKVTVRSQYRERPAPAPGELVAPPPAPDAPWLTRGEIEVALSETGPRTGVFVGRITTRLMPADTNDMKRLPPGEVYVNPEDKIVAEYVDAKHQRGIGPETKIAEVFALVGGSTDPQSIVAHSSEATIQAKKLLLEAQLLHKWGSIFKEVGLDDSAKEKAEEGLKRVAEVFELSALNTLDRLVIEQAYETRWNLYLVQSELRLAINTCNALVKRFPDTLLADRAFMQLAMARREEKNGTGVGAAIALFNAIIALPNSQFKAEAQYRIAETLENEERRRVAAASSSRVTAPNFATAMKAYERCAETYPSSAFAGESFKRMVDYYVSIKTYPHALEIVKRVFQDYPDAPWLDEILLKWGVVLHRQGDKDGSIAKFRQILEEYPEGESAKQAASFLKRLEAE